MPAPFCRTMVSACCNWVTSRLITSDRWAERIQHGSLFRALHGFRWTATHSARTQAVMAAVSLMQRPAARVKLRPQPQQTRCLALTGTVLRGTRSLLYLHPWPCFPPWMSRSLFVKCICTYQSVIPLRFGSLPAICSLDANVSFLSMVAIASI